MKKLIKFALGLAAIGCGGVGYSLSPHLEETHVEIINIREIDSPTLTRIMEGGAPELALEVNKNDALPLTIFLNGDFFELLSPDVGLYIKAKQNLYFRNASGNFLFSNDGHAWEPLSEAMTGVFTLLLNVDTPGSPSITLGADIYATEPER